MAQKISRWPLFSEATVRSHFSSGEIYGGQYGTGRRFFRLPRFSAVRIFSKQLHIYHHLHTWCSYSQDKRMKPGHGSNINEFSENAQHWLEALSHFLVFRLLITLAVLHRHGNRTRARLKLPLFQHQDQYR